MAEEAVEKESMKVPPLLRCELEKMCPLKAKAVSLTVLKGCPLWRRPCWGGVPVPEVVGVHDVAHCEADVLPGDLGRSRWACATLPLLLLLSEKDGSESRWLEAEAIAVATSRLLVLMDLL